MVRTQYFHCQGLGSIPGLVRELRSHKPQGVAKKKELSLLSKLLLVITKVKFLKIDLLNFITCI